MSSALVECVPNFSEGKDKNTIRSIARAIRSVKGVALLHIDPNPSANRTVMTFVGPPEQVAEAAFRAIKTAARRIDMRQQTGEHPRIGATDVCPLIPLFDYSMAQTSALATRLAERVGKQLAIPVYLYEHSATQPERRNLAHIRKGQYEEFHAKIKLPEWFPDFGPSDFNPITGATVIGARDFLVAFNVSLDTKDPKIAQRIAAHLRESGTTVTAPDGSRTHIPGSYKGLKAIGWYMEVFGQAQVSMNITDLRATPLHTAFDACLKIATEFNTQVTASELIGMIPIGAMLEAGNHYMECLGHTPKDMTETQIIAFAARQLRLPAFTPAVQHKRILELAIQKKRDTISLTSNS